MVKKSLISLLFVIFSFTLFANEKGKFLGAKDTTMPSWFLNSFLDLNEDIQSLSLENKRLIVFVHQNSCPYCCLFVNRNLENEKTKEKLLKHFGVIDINLFGSKEVLDTDQEELSEKEFGKKYNIQFTPTIIFYNEKGKQILRLNGYVNNQKFNLALDYIKNKKENSLPFNQYLIKQQEKGNFKLIDEPDLFTKSKNFSKNLENKKVAIFFESPNCKDCETLHKKLLKDETTRKLLKNLDIYQVNINSKEAIVSPKKIILSVQDWSNKLNITNIPTIVFFDKDANEIIRIESLLKNFHFQSIVDYVVSDSFKNEKEFQRFLTNRTNKIRNKGIDVNIWK